LRSIRVSDLQGLKRNDPNDHYQAFARNGDDLPQTAARIPVRRGGDLALALSSLDGELDLTPRYPVRVHAFKPTCRNCNVIAAGDKASNPFTEFDFRLHGSPRRR
jgi:hypothetical protein